MKKSVSEINEKKMTKKQHYIPRFYLERFSDDKGFVHIYDFKQNKSYKTKPENICYQTYLYEVEWNGTKEAYGKYLMPNHLENIFSRYEDEFSCFLRKLDRICYIGQNPNALILQSKKEKDTLFRLISNLFIRNPKVMEALSVNEIPTEIEGSDWLNPLRETLNLMKMGGGNDIVKLAIKKGYLTDEFGDGPVQDLCNEIRNLNFTFYRAQNNSFLTSDCPVFIGVDQHIPEHNKQCVYFVLSPKLAVLFENYNEFLHKNNRMVVVKDSIVDDFNIHMISKVKEFQGKIIANSSEITAISLCGRPLKC